MVDETLAFRSFMPCRRDPMQSQTRRLEAPKLCDTSTSRSLEGTSNASMKGRLADRIPGTRSRPPRPTLPRPKRPIAPSLKGKWQFLMLMRCGPLTFRRSLGPTRCSPPGGAHHPAGRDQLRQIQTFGSEDVYQKPGKPFPRGSPLISGRLPPRRTPQLAYRRAAERKLAVLDVINMNAEGEVRIRVANPLPGDGQIPSSPDLFDPLPSPGHGASPSCYP